MKNDSKKCFPLFLCPASQHNNSLCPIRVFSNYATASNLAQKLWKKAIEFLTSVNNRSR